MREIDRRWNVKGGNYMRDRASPDRFLSRMRYFLDLIGAPDARIKFIHVTGTSGKGSVSVMMQEALAAAGHQVGLFTSPYCTSAIEKIRVNNKYISPATFVRIWKQLKPSVQRADKSGPFGGPSYFEIFLAIALKYFQEQKCVWAVLEVGCGGRYDATNAIQKKSAAVITNIDFDHTQILGKTLPKIARDKAGIIKTGTEFFTTEKRPALLKIFRKICADHHAPTQIIARAVRSWRPRMLGQHQELNAALAAAVLKHLKIPQRAIINGIGRARLPCRFEIVQKNPTVIIDGAHNVGKMRSTANSLKDYLQQKKFGRVHLVIGIAADKDVRGILKQIVPLADTITTTGIHSAIKASLGPEKLHRLAQKFTKKTAPVRAFPNSKQALQWALRMAKINDIILITGSFYLAGEVRTCWVTEDFILKHRMSFKSL
ncbi:MAG: Mur ligase M protein [Candidatus Magasanikbacteria bacterium]|nr:Mur ligase M protein [Candidatus Magasanikbacteria bacterium]